MFVWTLVCVKFCAEINSNIPSWIFFDTNIFGYSLCWNFDVWLMLHSDASTKSTSLRFHAAAPDSPQATTWRADFNKIQWQLLKETREASWRSFGLNFEIADSISAHPCHWATSWGRKVKSLDFRILPLRQRPHLPRGWSPQSSCQLSRPQRRPWRGPAAWQGTPAWGAGSPCSSPPGGSSCNLEPAAFAGLEGSALANLVFDLAKSVWVGMI